MTAYEKLMDDRKKLVEKIIKNMENGAIFQKGWNSIILSPQNPVSDVYYLGGNRLRLMEKAIEANYKDPRWVTFNQAKENGWHVKKGEKSVLCEKWIYTKKEKDQNGNEVEEKLSKPFPSFFYLFNAEQIEGIPPLEIKQNTKEENFKIANDFIKSSECLIKEVAQDQAFYSPNIDEIVLPLREAFKSEESFLRTTLHEMSHSTGHSSRLNRDFSGEFGSPSYAREELVAELSAVFTQARLGIKLEGEHFNDHTAYLKSWIGILKENPNELFQALSKAEQASERLYTNYLEYQKISEKETLTKEDPFKTLEVTLHFSEYDFGIPDETTLKGSEAYNLLEKIIKFDIEQNIRQTLILDGNDDIPGLLYYKTDLSIVDENIKYKNFRVDLGDLEFGGEEKVSKALAHRLLKYIEISSDELKNRPQEMEKFYKRPVEELKKELEERKVVIDNFIEKFCEKEKILENSKNISTNFEFKDKTDKIFEFEKEDKTLNSSWNSKINNDKFNGMER
ncbi:zincin-like metallopeptidase domain-containing protein [uncultured Fusobacterium sp.]|uniref:ArdC family protein n=1 Tax=uncultured Fusobacterium sp. TaxID=159267 RepID=UPI0015A7189F|nr:zincin-like metallopeptidase domain-containing protein [uncultured Fusobacterium sp.]